MDEFEVEQTGEIDGLTTPVLVEGLPGVGHVGKLAAEHLLDEFESELVRRIYSTHFPPQVGVTDGLTQLASAELHAIETAETSVLVLTGDHQAQDGVGHYGLADTVLDIADAAGVSDLYTLGGIPTGELIEEYDVVAAATTEDKQDELEELVEFRGGEPAGGIVGVSGLLLGLAERRAVPAACLMGETSGYLVDPKSARAVLEVLQDVLAIEIGFDSLEDRADEMEQVVRKIQEMDDDGATPTDEDLRYIG
jgi:uncharacterized protein (TIGR00162 family)